MAAYDFNAPRLYLDAPLGVGATVSLDRNQANYLLNVLRLSAGHPVLVFNGRDGEWRATIASEGRKNAALSLVERARPQTPPSPVDYLFAPLKAARLDYLVQKAVEMGAGRLRPVRTRRTQVQRVNLERMRANVIEAAEQCGIIAVPEILDEAPLPRAVAALEADRWLVFCDEEAPESDPLAALARARPSHGEQEGNLAAKVAVVVGPEGGFEDEERRLLLAHPRVIRLSLGPRILRADTAVVAALALVQAVLGDGAARLVRDS
jgi:16S rRNA (uracil1498-N3)-methyltransferase